VTVTPGTVLNSGTANGAKLGINLDYWWDNDANRLSGYTPLATALGSAKLKVWRYPGGEKADGYLWSTSPFTASNPRLARISSSDWPSNDVAYWTPAGSATGTWAHPVMSFDQFMTACQSAGCTPNLVVAYDGIYKAAAAGGTSLTFQQALDTAKGWVTYAKSKSYSVGYWDIGNETWMSGYMGTDPGRTQQANDFVTFANAMHTIDPTAKICTNANTQADFATLLSIAHAQIDCLVSHSYPAWPYVDYSSYLGAATLIPDEVNMAYNAVQACSACTAADKSRIKIVENEYAGITYGISGTWTQNDLGHALMTAELTGRLAQDSRVAASEYWTTRWLHNTSDTPNDEYDALNAHNGLFAQGKALSLWGNNTLASMVSSTPQSGKVIPFASYDSGTKQLKVLLINKDTVASTVNVTLSGYTGGGTTGTVSALTGSASTSLTPSVVAQANVAVSGNAFSISLSPTSFTVVTIAAGAGPGPNLLTNPGLESGVGQAPTGWSESGTNVDASYSDTAGNNHAGSAKGVHWKASAYNVFTYQTKTGLVSGLYTFRAWVKSGGGQTSAALSAKGYGGADLSTPIPTTSTWTQVTIPNVNVTNGTITVGLASTAGASQWINFDDVELFKQ
jgi:alpha-L-arabinofuranosidase